MKFIIYIIFLQLCISCAQKKESNTTVTFQDKKQETVDKTQVSIDLEYIFKSDINHLTNDTILLFNKFKCDYTEKLKPKNTTIRFHNCEASINSFNLSDDFKLLKTNIWLEEALSHKDFYYKNDRYIIIFDYIKYCDSEIINEYILEQIRIYKSIDYYKIADKSSSIIYALKRIE